MTTYENKKRAAGSAYSDKQLMSHAKARAAFGRAEQIWREVPGCDPYKALSQAWAEVKAGTVQPNFTKRVRPPKSNPFMENPTMDNPLFENPFSDKQLMSHAKARAAFGRAEELWRAVPGCDPYKALAQAWGEVKAGTVAPNFTKRVRPPKSNPFMENPYMENPFSDKQLMSHAKARAAFGRAEQIWRQVPGCDPYKALAQAWGEVKAGTVKPNFTKRVRPPKSNPYLENPGPDGRLSQQELMEQKAKLTPHLDAGMSHSDVRKKFNLTYPMYMAILRCGGGGGKRSRKNPYSDF